MGADLLLNDCSGTVGPPVRDRLFCYEQCLPGVCCYVYVKNSPNLLTRVAACFSFA
jgi:hypothetical protein